MGGRQKLASVSFLRAFSAVCFSKAVQAEDTAQHMLGELSRSRRDARETDKSESAAELDGCVLHGYFPKITQMLSSGAATNATSSGNHDRDRAAPHKVEAGQFQSSPKC